MPSIRNFLRALLNYVRAWVRLLRWHWGGNYHAFIAAHQGRNDEQHD
jgi:hypothetical protein